MVNIGLLLQQSYNDVWSDYRRSLDGEIQTWDYLVITASNESQAESYGAQLDSRLQYLPKNTKYLVIPDAGGKRIGSGGSTLSVIRAIAADCGGIETINGKRILVIHSGGDSKRVPQYSALGKLFSPVPHELPDGRPSTLFDEILVSVSAVPGRIPEGMLLLSGDAQLLFNPLLIDWDGKNAAAISFKEDVETGKEHGVFLAPSGSTVSRFLHKQPEETLRNLGAVDEYNRVNIDTGAVLFSTDILKSLYSLGDKYINETVRLSLYGDFLYPLAEESTLENFLLEKPEGTFCEELTEARKDVWSALRPYRLKLLKLAPAKFTHFGTTKEILNLMNGGIADYSELGWSNVIASSIYCRTCVSAYCSIVSPNAEIGSGCYFESSRIHDNVTIGDNSVLSYINIDNVEIPSNVVVHGLRLKNGRFVCRIWDVDDNPKDFWFEPRYPVCASMDEAVRASLKLFHGGKLSGKYELLSLADGFNMADTAALLDWDRHMKEAVIESLPLPRKLKKLFSLKRSDDAFKAIRKAVLPEEIKSRGISTCKKESVTVKLPLRVNFGGGWTDTPPYCLENGGTVLNAAILLNGEMPIEVSIKKLPEKKIVFESKDMHVHGEFSGFEELQDTGNPFDPFALQKACLKACGITESDCGFIIDSEVTGVPKGSGLGTSSILAAACCKAILEFFGIEYTEDELVAYVLQAEQIMSTGGGWQDQVGGLILGIKFLTSEPGVHQKIKVESLELSNETIEELNERFSVVYTGQRRLARYLLRDVIGRYVSGEEESIKAHKKIKELAAQMKQALENGDVDAFAVLLNEHWEYSKMIDAGSSNALIEQIFMSIEDLIDARMVCGAGGGGFLQIIKKKGVTDGQIHERLKEYFGDSGIDIWETEICWNKMF